MTAQQPPTAVLGLIGSLSNSEPGWYHNSAAALVIEGEIITAVEEERLNRLKDSGVFPTMALQHCIAELHSLGISRAWFAFGEEGGEGELRDRSLSRPALTQTIGAAVDGQVNILGIDLYDHHKAHAASAFLPAPFDAAIVFTLDGFGDGRSGSVWLGRNHELVEQLSSVPFTASFGRFYSSALPHLGFRENEDWKMMGLAALGDPTTFGEVLSKTYCLQPDGRVDLQHGDALLSVIQGFGPARMRDEPPSRLHADIAAAVQASFERMLSHWVSHHVNSTGIRTVCFAGGAAQNSLAVGRLRERKVVDRVFVQPAAHDGGLAVGAALLTSQRLKRGPVARHFNPFLGPNLRQGSSDNSAVTRWGASLSVSAPASIPKVIAELIHSGHVVGLAQGRSEFGPRALGNRSILADPTRESTKDIVNSAIKSREAFRPFAPVVHERAAGELFGLSVADAYQFAHMTITMRVSERVRQLLPATTHHDGTSRLQVAFERFSPRLCQILDEFEKLSGVPVLLNTSLNNSYEPMVQNIDDCITMLLTSGLDVLAIDDEIVMKASTGFDSLDSAIIRLGAGVRLSSEDLDSDFGRILSNKASLTLPLAWVKRLSKPDPPSVSELRGLYDDPHLLAKLWALRLVTLRPGA